MAYLSTQDGYNIEFQNQRNRIVIGLPQTPTTATNTFWPVSNRKTEVTDTELASVLGLVRMIFKEEEKH